MDVPIKQYVPNFRMRDSGVTNNLTIRHLLTHTGGWEGDILVHPDKGEDTAKETMNIIAELPQLTPIGKVWAYNPVGFYILGYVLETVAGMPYEKLLKEFVLRPLGMHDSVFTAGEKIIGKAAVGHYCVDGRPVVATPWELPRSIRPSGGLISSLSDMMKYLDFLLSPWRRTTFRTKWT